jgi:hypothetical protein
LASESPATVLAPRRPDSTLPAFSGAPGEQVPGNALVSEGSESGSAVPVVPRSLRRATERYQRPFWNEWGQLHGLSADEYLAALRQKIARMVARSRVVVAVPQQVVPALVADGRFRNIWEIARHVAKPDHNTEDYLRTRKEQERLFFGIPEHAPADSRPIYGLLGNPDTDYVEEGYGVRAILADTVRPRTMVAWGCPMAIVGGGFLPRFHPVLVGDQNLEAALWLKDARATIEMEVMGLDSATIYDPLSLPDDDTLYLCFDDQPVAAIFGGVSLSEVEELVLPAPDAELEALLDQASVPWRTREGVSLVGV